MDYDFVYDGISLKNKRDTNMDSVVMCLREIQGKKIGLFVVCDGVGSNPNGGEASRFLTTELSQWFFDLTLPRKFGVILNRQVLELNHALIDQEHGGTSTLTAMLLTPSRAYFTHVGDTRVYQSDKQLIAPWTQLSTDQKNPENALVDYMGKPKQLVIDSWEVPVTTTRFLLCSDGFYNRLDWTTAAPALAQANKHSIRPTLESLAQDVIDKGEQDNASALLISVNC